MSNNKSCEQPCHCDTSCSKPQKLGEIKTPMSHKQADDLLNMIGNGSFALIRAVERFHGIE